MYPSQPSDSLPHPFPCLPSSWQHTLSTTSESLLFACCQCCQRSKIASVPNGHGLVHGVCPSHLYAINCAWLVVEHHRDHPSSCCLVESHISIGYSIQRLLSMLAYLPCREDASKKASILPCHFRVWPLVDPWSSFFVSFGDKTVAGTIVAQLRNDRLRTRAPSCRHLSHPGHLIQSTCWPKWVHHSLELGIWLRSMKRSICRSILHMPGSSWWEVLSALRVHPWVPMDVVQVDQLCLMPWLT